MIQVLLGHALAAQIGTLERCVQAQHRGSETSRRLETIPGIGVIGATAITATVTDPSAFRSGRELAARIGLVPRQGVFAPAENLDEVMQLCPVSPQVNNPQYDAENCVAPLVNEAS